jgi:hypothetical protein
MLAISGMSPYVYPAHILDELARHGLCPGPTTTPQQLRDAVLDLYKYEIGVLKQRLLSGAFERREYAGRVIALRTRYPLLSLPLPLWTVPPSS